MSFRVLPEVFAIDDSNRGERGVEVIQETGFDADAPRGVGRLSVGSGGPAFAERGLVHGDPPSWCTTSSLPQGHSFHPCAGQRSPIKIQARPTTGAPTTPPLKYATVHGTVISNNNGTKRRVSPRATRQPDIDSTGLNCHQRSNSAPRHTANQAKSCHRSSAVSSKATGAAAATSSPATRARHTGPRRKAQGPRPKAQCPGRRA